MKCPEQDCTGDVDTDGYCTVTGMKISTLAGSQPTSAVTTPVTNPVGPSSVGAASSFADGGATGAGSRGSRRRSTSKTSAARNRLGGGLTEIPSIPEHDPTTAVLDNPVVPESKRFCAVDGQAVGRSRNGVAGRSEGFCPKCGHPYSFTPKLKPGDVVGGQYEVVGCLAHGGLGWIYLARDLKVEQRWVVLKGLLNTGDADALEAALAERRFLATVDHSDIVKIYNVAEHGSDGYIVMEYVRGKSLRGLLEAHREANNGAPLPLAHALAYIHGILPALGYLHGLRLLFCDFKPDNVMQTGMSLKLIDLGGVYRMDDETSPIYGTKGYQAPEIADTGPTIASDLFTVARTLAVLCTNLRGYQAMYEHTLPPPDEVPLFAEYDSLYRFLQRATALDPDDRFQSAEEMGEQLLGVWREVAAREKGTPFPGSSNLFTSELSSASDALDWRALPALLVSTDDPASGFLATLAASTKDPASQAVALDTATVRTVEVSLQHARALIETGHVDEAEFVLAGIEHDDEWEWRVAWYRGLLALANNDSDAAIDSFSRVYSTVPGELAPRLALGFAHEAAGQIDDAERYYDIVSRTDSGYTSAAFGLARCRLHRGEGSGAIAAYDRIARSSGAYVDAQVAKASAMLESVDDVNLVDVVAAGTIVEDLRLGGELRARLVAKVFDAALSLLRAGAPPEPQQTLLGFPLDESGLRLGLERTYRTLARFARPGEQRIALVDLANSVRPRTLV